MRKEKSGIETLAVHGGDLGERFYGAVNLPIFQSSTYSSTGREEYKDIRYMRLNNSPNHLSLHKKIAAFEGTDSALVFGSGMAAISTALLSVLKAGDHMLAQNCLYGGTYGLLLEDAPSLGWSYDFIDAHAPSQWEKFLKPNTKAIYVEAITNPLVQVAELEAIAAFAKKHKLVALIDATFASPINFQPAKLGFDLIIHSCTKYMNGHSDIIAGCVSGSHAWIEKVNAKAIHFGGMLDTHTCFLLDRGLKTLPMRMEHHNRNALGLARFLEAHANVERVYYPGLETHSDHGRAKKWFSGFGGVLSFELKTTAAETEAMLHRLKIPVFAPSLGGVESLITMPALSTHKAIPREMRLGMGISDKLVRVAVGVESLPDLIDDFKQALP